MRYEDASQAGAIGSDVAARDDTEHLAGNDFGPATGNTITGLGTVSGATGTDLVGPGGQITAIAGAGGSDNTFDAEGKLEVAGQYGTLSIDAQGNYTYVRTAGSPEGVTDTFTYTLANNAGATDSAKLVIAIGDPPILQAQGTQTIQTNNGVVVLPAGVELSDIRVVGRDLVITLPDGSTMVIPDGAVFVPQLVINGVEVPASNLAALLIDAEPRPAAGELTAAQQSSGGNFALPPGPLDPGVPLGDLLPPTELSYTPPEVDELFEDVDNDPPEITPSAINVSDEGVSSVNAPLPDNAGTPDTTNLRIVNGHITVVDPDGDPVTITMGAPSAALTSQGVPITWTVSPDGHTVIGSAGVNEVIRIVIEDDGDYTVTQSRPVDHPNTSIEDGVSFVIPVFATDGEDDAAPSSITVTIEDDSPTITGQVSEPILVTDDTTLNINDIEGISGAFAAAFGADGPHATTPIGYAMGINAGATGLFDTLSGDQVVLTLESGVVVGRAGAGGPIVFTVSVDGSGNVTLDQQRAVVHNDPSDPAETNASGSAATLAADNLVTVSIVATDRDGDQASLVVNLGHNLRFEDDGPTIDRNQTAAPVLVTDDTNTPNDVDGPVSFAGLFTGVFGNDGFKDADDNDVEDADAIRFSLSVTGGNGTPSGLFDVLTGDAILLRVNGAGDIEGYLQGSPSTIAFTIDLDANTGSISLEQDRAITHNDPNDPIESGDSAAQMASGLIVLTATIEDGDGDTDTATANIGNSFRFEDDGPSIERSAATVPQLVTDDTDTPNDTAGPVSFAGLFDSNFGKDGPKDVDDNDVADPDAIAYSLSITGGNGTDSGLDDVLTGDNILLRVNGAGDIEGYLQGSPGTVAFTIDLDPATGNITLEQDRAITHNDPTDPFETNASGSAAQMASNLIVLNATITDGDLDTDTASANIGDAFRFEDDGPSIERNGQSAPNLVTDDTDTPNDTDGPVSFAGLFTANFGKDGFKDADDNDVEDADAIAYSLSITGGNGTDSGLNDVLTGDNILLRVVGNSIEGYLQGDPTVVAFTLTLDPNTGTITQEQDRAITHDDPTDAVESGPDAETMAANLIVLTATITDGDGDTDTATANIGDAFHFEDDGPSITRNEAQAPILVTDDTDTPNDTDGPDSFAGLFDVDFGADGPKDVDDNDVADADAIVYSLSITGGNGTDSGLNDVVTGDDILLRVVGNTIEGYLENNTSVVAFTITLNPGTGQISLEQDRAITHNDPNDPVETGGSAATMAANLIVLNATITDGDGDTDTASANIGDSFQFEDDGPVAVDDVDSVGAPGTTATGNVITGIDIVGGDANTTDGNPDDVGADTPGAIVGVAAGDTDTALTNPATVGVQIQGAFGKLTLNSDGSYTYTRDAGTPGGGEDVFTYTLRDADGDRVTATLTIEIGDAIPVAGTESATVDDDGLPNANPGGTNDINANLGETPSTNNSEAIFNGTLNASGGDGTLTFSLVEPADGATVGQETVNYTLVGNLLTATIATSPDASRVGDTLFTVELVNPTTGDYVVTLEDNVLHGDDANNDEDGIEVEVTVPYQVEDEDGSTSAGNGQLTISFNDDVPDVVAVLNTDAAVELDETLPSSATTITLVGVTKGNDPDLSDATGTAIGRAVSAESVLTLTTALYGADGPAANPDDAVYSLTVNNAVSGLTTTEGDAITLVSQQNGTVVVGVVQTGTFAGQAAFAIAIDPETGVITVEQYLSLDHPVEGSTAAAHNDPVSMTAGHISANVTIEDADGDTDSATGIDISGLITFRDDGPDVAAVLNTDAAVELDESLPSSASTITLVGVTKGNDPGHPDTDGIAIGRAVAAESVLTLTTVNYGADGPAANPEDASYSLVVDNAVSGLTTTEGNAITLVSQQNGTVVVGIVQGGTFAGQAAFAIAIDPETGVITVEQYLSLDHPVEGSTAAAHNDPLSMTAGHVSAVVTIEDGDGDTDSSTPVDISGLITFRDDGPTITAVTDPLEIANTGTTPSGTGNFDFDVGADDNADFDDISVSGFTITIDGEAAQNVVLTADVDGAGNPAPETATTASYRFTFEYDTGDGGTEQGVGTLVFNKTDGSYTVTLLSGPIQGFSIVQTATGTLFQGYEFGTSTPDGSQPEISVTQIRGDPLDPQPDDLFLQFTSVAEPSSGTGDNNLEVSTWVPGTDNPPPVDGGGDMTWNAGQLFNQDDSWVSTSNTANGVAGDTIQGGEVLDFTIVEGANPTGVLAQPAQFGTATSMFLKFDGIGSSEDMIVILKLYDPTTDTYTTRAVMIQNSDIIKGPGTGPGDYSSITLDNNDGLVIIEQNDYALPTENWVIVGAQIAGSDEGVDGTAVNLNGAVNVDLNGDGDFTDAGESSGDSDVNNDGALDTQAFSTDVDNGPFKISSIGLISEATEDQQATIEFDVTITDGDNDTVTQNDITVNIGGAAETLAASEKGGPTVMEEQSSTSSLLTTGTQEVERVAANSNSVTLAAAVGAAGLVSGSAAAAKSTIAVQDDISVVSAFSQAGVADLGGSDLSGRFASIAAFQDSGFDFGATTMASTSPNAIMANHIGELTTSLSMASGPNALLEATDFGATMQAMPMPATALNVAMPSADSLAAQAAGVEAGVNAKVGAIIQDALQGGSGGDIDALLSALPGAGLGDNAGLKGLATPVMDGVQTWDMGHGGGFTFDVASIITSEAMVLHHDAVQPVANG